MYSRCEMQICYKMQIVINLFVSSILTSFCDPICELYHQTHSTPPLHFISTLHIHMDTFFVLLSHSLSLLFIHFTTYLLYISFISFTHTHTNECIYLCIISYPCKDLFYQVKITLLILSKFLPDSKTEKIYIFSRLITTKQQNIAE